MSRLENHNLYHRRRSDSDVLRDAECSCGRWQLRNATLEEIRRAHTLHLLGELGTDAQERRANAAN